MKTMDRVIKIYIVLFAVYFASELLYAFHSGAVARLMEVAK